MEALLQYRKTTYRSEIPTTCTRKQGGWYQFKNGLDTNLKTGLKIEISEFPLMKIIYRKREKTLKYFISILLISAVLISIIGLNKDFKNTIEYGTVDLRDRIVGARLLIEKQDPYFYHWKEGEPERFYNGWDNNSLPISRAQVTPAVLTFFSIFAGFSFKTIKIIWFLTQWSFLIGSIALLANSTKCWLKSRIIWIFSLIVISGSSFWRLHVERGQSYIFYIFLIALSYWIYNRNFKGNHIVSGFFIGLAITTRPTYILMCIPILIYKKFKIMLGIISGTIIGILIPFVYGNFSIWKSYFTMSNIFANSFINGPNVLSSGIVPDRVVEGLSNLKTMAPMHVSDTSVISVFKYILKIDLTWNSLIILLLLVLAIATIILIIFREGSNNIKLIFLIGLVLSLIAAFFLPAPRYSYQNVIWLLLFAVLIDYADPLKRLMNPLIIILIPGLFFSIAIYFAPRGTLFSDIVIPLYLIFITFYIIVQNWINERKKYSLIKNNTNTDLRHSIKSFFKSR